MPAVFPADVDALTSKEGDTELAIPDHHGDGPGVHPRARIR
jgi:hypothetical protein